MGMNVRSNMMLLLMMMMMMMMNVISKRTLVLWVLTLDWDILILMEPE